jgi:hypothetical protein
MKKKIKQIIQSLLKNVLGIQIYRVKKKTPDEEKPQLKMKYVHDPAYSYMALPEHQERLNAELAQVVDGFLANNFFPNASGTSSLQIVRDFFAIYRHREKTDNTHGSGFHNAFWLYTISRILDPELIVESGVWKGHASWLMDQACPNADQYGFDISLNKYEFPNLNAQMFEQDWQTFSFPSFDPDKALIFFDCHINHAQRIIEAKAKGFKHLLFDDNPPIHKIFSHMPGIPTAAMLAAKEGIDTPEISWVWNGKEVTEPIDLEEARQASELIKAHHMLADVGCLTRYGGFAFLTYVQI